MSTAPYKTLRQEAADEVIINKSRFIGYACPCETEEEALAFLNKIRTKHKDATHNCYAYVIGKNSGIMRYSDDGEPGGTAGLPMMEVLKAQGVVNCCVVVTRYFGGILLGAGGLVRAYTKGAKIAIDAAGKSMKRVWTVLYVPCPYTYYERLKLEVEAFGGVIRKTDFGSEVELEILVAQPKAQAFLDKLTDMTAGTVDALELGQEYRAFPVTQEED